MMPSLFFGLSYSDGREANLGPAVLRRQDRGRVAMLHATMSSLHSGVSVCGWPSSSFWYTCAEYEAEAMAWCASVMLAVNKAAMAKYHVYKVEGDG